MDLIHMYNCQSWEGAFNFCLGSDVQHGVFKWPEFKTTMHICLEIGEKALIYLLKKWWRIKSLQILPVCISGAKKQAFCGNCSQFWHLYSFTIAQKYDYMLSWIPNENVSKIYKVPLCSLRVAYCSFVDYPTSLKHHEYQYLKYISKIQKFNHPFTHQ